MKNKTNRLPSSVLLALLLSWAGLNIVSAGTESHIYAPGQIHHYSSNAGASTVSVEIAHHYRFENGKYVWIPSHLAEAPLPKDKWAAAVWVSPSATVPAHWLIQK